MAGTKDALLETLRSGGQLKGREQLKLTFLLAVPAILAQLSMCLMSYIDAAMVGRLGSTQAAAVGLVSTTTWIFGSFCYANSSGFSVQIAHRCGAKDFEGARKIFRQGLMTVVGFSLLLTALASAISSPLPGWLGGSADIAGDASSYFLIYALFIPIGQITIFAESSLIASGNVKVPSIVAITMCVLDVCFNYLFIYVMNMGVKGAALGTGIAQLCCGAFLLTYALTRSNELRSERIWSMQPGRPVPGFRTVRMAEEAAEKKAETAGFRKGILAQAWHITWPLWIQNIVTRGAFIAATVIIAPLGTIAIAANSFAIIAEGFCYLPGYGMEDAATTLVGQSLGAGRRDMAKRFAWITIGSGASLMTALAILMWIFAPQMMGLLSPDQAIIDLGAKCLRIEAWAELLYAVSIVAYGCCVGAGDTLVPSIINLGSMWVIRIGLALLLIPHYGLEGYWFAMATELSIKGLVFAVRIRRGRWMRSRLTKSESVN